MFGIGSIVVTLVLLGGALAQVDDVVTVIPGLGGESFPVKKRSVDKPIEIFELPFDDDIFPFDFDAEPQSEPQDVVVHLQSMPIEFNFEEVIPARYKRATKDKEVKLQQQMIPFDLDFVIRDKRDVKDKKIQLQKQMIPFDIDFVIRDRRAILSIIPDRRKPRKIYHISDFKINAH